MSLFKKKNADGTQAVNTPHANKHTRSKREPYSMQKRPSFGQWLKLTGLDILTMAALGAIGLGVCGLCFCCFSIFLPSL